MEVAAAALSAITSAFTTAAPVVGSEVAASAAAAAGQTVASSAASGAGFLSGSGSLISSIFQGTAGVLSAFGAMGQGASQSDAMNARATDADTEAQLETVKGGERRIGLRRALADALAERDVAAAASGVDLSFGTPALARDEALKEGERALTADQSTEDFRIARLRERAAELRRGAKEASRGGLIRAMGAGLTTGASIAKRG